MEGNMAQASTRSSSKDKPSSNGSKESISGSGRSKASEGGNASDNKPARSAGKAVVAGVVTGAAGVVAGAVLGARLGKGPKRVFGVRVPGSGRGLDDVVKEVGKAGKQFKKVSGHVGVLTSEVQAARKKAEEIGRIVT
jgi:hypothetical protein